MLELKEGKKATIEVMVFTRAGNRAAIEPGTARFTSSDESVVSVTQDPDNELKAVIRGLDGSNNESVVIEFHADGDRSTEGVKPIVGAMSVTCTTGDAITASMSAGTVEDDEPEAQPEPTPEPAPEVIPEPTPETPAPVDPATEPETGNEPTEPGPNTDPLDPPAETDPGEIVGDNDGGPTTEPLPGPPNEAPEGEPIDAPVGDPAPPLDPADVNPSTPIEPGPDDVPADPETPRTF